MADFALGLTKTAVEGTLSRVKSAIEEEAKLKMTVQHDLMFITGEFQLMQSFLMVVTKERANNEVVKTWVRQLRDLAFDVEDCVEFVVHLDKSSTWSWMWRLVPSCMAPPRHLDAAVAEIKLLKARVEEVSQRNARYNLISDSGSKHVSSPPPPEDAFDILRDIWLVEGNICSMTGLEFLIADVSDGREVISVWESTRDDIGAASIFKKLYSDPVVCNMFSGSCAWVKLVHPFNPDGFIQSMLTQFSSSFQDPTNPGTYDFRERVRAVLAMGHDVKKEQELKQFLSDEQRPYLVILEDVSTVAEWHFISSILPNNRKSKIVVLTKQWNIAEKSIECPLQVLKFFSGQSSFVFVNKNHAHRSGVGNRKASRSPLEEARKFIEDEEILPIWTDDELWSLEDQLRKKHGVTSVWGITGLGKSSLVREKYYKSLIAAYEKRTSGWTASINPPQIYDKYSWVDVPNPFNLVEFPRRLCLGFYSDDHEPKSQKAVLMVEGRQCDPIERPLWILDRMKCLIVIDDVRSTEDWDTIKAAFPQLHSDGSSVVVITSQANVARHCVNNDESKMVNIKGLDADAAFLLLKKIIWGEDHYLTLEEEKLSKHTVARCGGLPTVIFAISEYCSRANYKKNKCLLEDIKSDFINKLETHPDLQHLFSWIRSYFDGCSDSVKPCIFYLSVFPSGSKIRRSRLIRRCIAEGYSRNTLGRTAEENAANLFSELVNLSIIQQTENKLISQVNTFFHEYIISQPMEDNLVFALEGSCSPNTQRAGRHLTIRKCWDKDINVFKSIDFSRLRSLTVLGEWKPFFISNEYGMRVLRVLDLEGSVGVTYHDLEEIGRLLPRLKFLSLRGCRQVEQLPDSFGGLKQLQTLDVRHTSIVILPPAIFQIEKLQYIRAGTSAWHANDDMLKIVEAVDDTTTIPPAEDGDHTSTAQQDGDGSTPRQDSDETGSSASSVSIASHAHDDTTPVPPEEDGDHTSTAQQQEGDGSSPRQDGDETARILPENDRDRASPLQEDCRHASTQGQADPPQAAQKNKTWPSWLGFSKKSKLRASAQNEGVKVPAGAGIGKLTTLHTLGVINVKVAGSTKAILEELKKLTQLRKLGVSGINSGNIKDFFSAISDHRHLESLSLRLDDNFPDGISLQNPVAETLKSLKLYGNIRQIPVSLIEQLGNLKKLKLELTISGQEDYIDLSGLAPGRIGSILTRLFVNLSQGGKLRFRDDSVRLYFSFAVLEIDCISNSSDLDFESSSMIHMGKVELLKVRCSKEASLTISGLRDLENLKEVWLMGSFDDTLKQEMHQQLARHKNKPVLKLVEHCSS